MEEMREVARLNRDYLASALVIIVLVVGLVLDSNWPGCSMLKLSFPLSWIG